MQLFAHQKEGIAFLKEKKKVILADEMGLGKTRQAIIAAGEETAASTLIICPASLKTNWQREIEAVAPNDDVFVVQSGKEKDLPTVKWIIINYDMLGKYYEQLASMKALGMIGAAICDEAHYIKGKKAVRSKLTLMLLDGLPIVYMLTGTPIMNRPAEMLNLLKAVGHPVADRASFFEKRYCDAYMETIIRRGRAPIRFWNATGASNLNELREITRDCLLRRMKKDVLDLPEKMISVRFCELTPDQKKAYDHAWDQYLEWYKNGLDQVLPEGDTGISCSSCGRELTDEELGPDGENDCFKCSKIERTVSAQQLVELGKLKQVCSLSKVSRIAADIADAVEAGEKVIVFTQYTKTLEEVAAACREIKVETGAKATYGKIPTKKIKVVTLSGQDSQEKRQAAVDAFQNDPETKVFVSNMKAGGVGLTLTQARIVMFADMEWSPEIHAQAEDRAHRIGQEGTVNVYYYVMEKTIEEDIVDLLEAKRRIIKEVMEGSRDRMSGSMAADFLDRLKQRLGKTR